MNKIITKDSQITIVNVSSLADKDASAPRVWADGSKYTYEFYLAGHISDDKDLTFGVIGTAEVRAWHDFKGNDEIIFSVYCNLIGIRGVTDINDGYELENEDATSASNRSRLLELIDQKVNDPKVRQEITKVLIARHLRVRGV